MIDSVLKGTGNSRFLKSAVPAGTSWADALAMLQAGTFPVDFNGINTEGFQQIGTPLNKANLLKDATAAQIGLPPSTTPDDMFQALAKTGELHVWRKTVIYNQPVPEVPGSYTLGSAAQCTAGRRNTSTSSSSYISNLSVSNEISVDLDGNVTLVNPSTVSLRVTRPASFASDSARTALGGYCYFMATDDTIGEACDMYLPRGKIFYVAENAVYTYAIKQYDSTSSFDAAQPVTGVPGTPAIPAGTTTTYPVSTNPNAYQEGDDAKPAGYTLGDVKTGSFLLAGSGGVFYHVGSSVTVSDDGTLSIVSPNNYALYRDNNSQTSFLNNFRGKFVQAYDGLKNCGAPFSTGAIVFIPSDATTAGLLYADRYQPVTGYAAIPAGTTIEYLGKLGDKARVQVVSYVGTGTSGAAHPTTVTFNFAPKIVIVSSQYYSGEFAYAYCAILAPDLGAGVSIYSSKSGMSKSGYSLFVKKEGKTISFYNEDNRYIAQMNDSGKKYAAIAIG